MQLIHRAVTRSTNADVLELARDGAAEGTWLFADQQQAGRGRQGRAWVSPIGNLYASTLVRVGVCDPSPASLALLSGLVVHAVIADLVAPSVPVLKWPNDVFVAGAKLAGILLERERDVVVIGIGINLVSHPDNVGQPATNVYAQKGTAPEPKAVVERLSRALETWIATWRSDGMSRICSAWVERAHPVGTPLKVEIAPGERVSGTFAGLDPTGALRLRLADGAISIVHAGDVFFG